MQCGEPRKIYVVPGEGKFLRNRDKVEEYLAGKTDQGLPIEGCTFGGCATSKATEAALAPEGASETDSAALAEEKRERDDACNAAQADAPSPASASGRQEVKVAPSTRSGDANLRRWFAAASPQKRQPAAQDTPDGAAAEACSLADASTSQAPASALPNANLRRYFSAPSPQQATLGAKQPLAAVDLATDDAAAGNTATAARPKDLRLFFGTAAPQAPPVEEIVAEDASGDAVEVDAPPSGGSTGAGGHRRHRPRFSKGLLSAHFARQKRKADSQEERSASEEAATPERRLPKEAPADGRLLSVAKTSPSQPAQDAVAERKPPMKKRPPASSVTAMLLAAAAASAAKQDSVLEEEAVDAKAQGSAEDAGQKRQLGLLGCSGGPTKVPRQGAAMPAPVPACAAPTTTPLFPLWCDRHAPTTLKDLRPKPVWASLQRWLSGWARPDDSAQSQKRKPAALLQGPLGSGKSTGARLVAQKLLGHFMEHHLGEREGRAFLENVLRRQQNCDQVMRNTVLIFDVPPDPSPDLKYKLFHAVQVSRSPIILVAGEGTLTSADSVVSHCLELRQQLMPALIGRIVQNIAWKESEKRDDSAAHEAIARSCAGDLRRALTAAQLLGPRSLAEVPPPWAAISHGSVCGHLLSAEPGCSLAERAELLAQGEEMPTALHERYLGGVAARSRGRDPQALLDGCAAAADRLCLHDVAAVADAQAAWAGGPDMNSVVMDDLLLAVASAATTAAALPAALPTRGVPTEWEASPAPDISTPVTWETCSRLESELQIPRAWIREQIYMWRQRCRTSRSRTEAQFRRWIRERADRCFRSVVCQEAECHLMPSMVANIVVFDVEAEEKCDAEGEGGMEVEAQAEAEGGMEVEEKCDASAGAVGGTAGSAAEAAAAEAAQEGGPLEAAEGEGPACEGGDSPASRAVACAPTPAPVEGTGERRSKRVRIRRFADAD